MLRNLLGRFGEVKILPESHFIIPLFEKVGFNPISAEEFLEVVDNIYSARGNRFVLNILKSAEKYYGNYKERYLTYLRDNGVSGGIKEHTEAFYDFLYGKNFIIGDKTPHYGIHASVIKTIWPEAKFIHAVRDGVDVAYSMTRHPGFKKIISKGVHPENVDEFMYGPEIATMEEPEITIGQAIEFWQSAINETANSLEKIDKQDVMTVRYEDIVHYPNETIYNLSKFLHIDEDKRGLRRAKLVPKPFPEARLSRKLDKETYNKLFEKVEGTMIHFGYPYEVTHDRRGWGFSKEVFRGREYYIKTGIKYAKTLGKQYLKKT